MFFRVLLLFTFSSASWGAGISICIDTIVTIGSIQYIDTSELLEKGLSSYSNKKIGANQSCSEPDPSKILSPVIVEQSDLSLSVLYFDDYLRKKNVSFDGGIIETEYPIPAFDYSRAYLVGDIPHLVDTENNLIWQWDSALEYWKDLSAVVTLPVGVYDEYALVYGDTFYFSVMSGENKGIWKLGLTTKKVSDRTWSEAKLVATREGLAQFYLETSNSYRLIGLGALDLDLSFEFDPGNITNVNAHAANNGTVFSIYGDGSNTPHLYWYSLDKLNSFIELPENIMAFGGCFNSGLQVFCAMEVKEQGFSLYEAVNGVLELDAVINNDTFDLSIINLKGVYAVGKNRFISFQQENGSYLYNANENGQFLIDFGDSDNTLYYLYQSRNGGKFYWMEHGSYEVVINKAVISGNLTYQRLYEETIVDGELQPSDSAESVTDEKSVTDKEPIVDGELQPSDSAEPVIDDKLASSGDELLSSGDKEIVADDLEPSTDEKSGGSASNNELKQDALDTEEGLGGMSYLMLCLLLMLIPRIRRESSVTPRS
jgi:hypothetical protein